MMENRRVFLPQGLPKTAQGVPEASQDHPFSTWVPQMVVLFGVFKKHAKNERRLLRVVLRFHCFWYFTFNKEPPRAPKEAPKEHPELPRTPKSFQGALKNSQRLPKEPPRAPKEHPRAPKEHPRAPKEPPGSLSQCAYVDKEHPRDPKELQQIPGRPKLPDLTACEPPTYQAPKLRSLRTTKNPTLQAS